MLPTLKPAGWIVADNEVIHATGTTESEAWQAFLTTMRQAGIRVITDEADIPENDFGGDWTRASNFRILAASQALLDQVEDRGGAISWGSLGGVACTWAEAEGEAA